MQNIPSNNKHVTKGSKTKVEKWVTTIAKGGHSGGQQGGGGMHGGMGNIGRSI